MWFILAILYLCSAAVAYPTGAPKGACQFMIPGHGVGPQSTPAPYSIMLSSECYMPGEPLKVTLKGSKSFLGFLLRADKGIFSPLEKITKLNCKKAAVTHTLDGRKMFEEDRAKSIQHVWTAPPKGMGTICFNATVVHQYDTFWTGISICIPECSRCKDFISKKNPAEVTITNKKDQKRMKKLKSCKLLGRKVFSGFCSPDALGGEDHACCEFCEGKCVDSNTWKALGAKCKDCTCAQIKANGLMEKCCAMNWNGVGMDKKKYRCKEMCCDSCA